MAELTAVPGIGPWTVQGALLIALQREDVILPGGLALRKAVQAAYRLDHLPSQQRSLASPRNGGLTAAWRLTTCFRRLRAGRYTPDRPVRDVVAGRGAVDHIA
jgi:3-methyladenine DNA glycosylase/8-oxoguanine DNA glycosylase